VAISTGLRWRIESASGGEFAGPRSMDVHKETIVVAVTATGDVGKATPYGTFPNTAAALGKLVNRLRQAGSGPLKFCYEAGPCGYGVHRTLSKVGEHCVVVAPSMIPRKSGDRQKNDRAQPANHGRAINACAEEERDWPRKCHSCF